MDRLVKRSAILAVSLIAIAGLAGAIGLYRAASKLERDSKSTAASPQLAAAISLAPVTVVVADTAPPVAPKEVVTAAKQDLASAFGAALGIDPSKVPSHTGAPTSNAATTLPRTNSSDSLDLGASASERSAKLGDRAAKAFDIRQNGGAAPEQKDKQPRERVSFETDLGNPSAP